jgi:hypothetical protein
VFCFCVRRDYFAAELNIRATCPRARAETDEKTKPLVLAWAEATADLPLVDDLAEYAPQVASVTKRCFGAAAEPWQFVFVVFVFSRWRNGCSFRAEAGTANVFNGFTKLLRASRETEWR